MSAIDDIRARHARQESVNAAWSPNQIPQAHRDRGVLLRVVDDQAAEIAEMQNQLDACEGQADSLAALDAENTRLREALVERGGSEDSLSYLLAVATVILDRHYPADVFVGGETPGPTFVAAFRELCAVLHPVEANQEAQHGE